MSVAKEIHIPDLGGVDEVDLIEVLVSPGDQVEAEQGLVTLESEKASMDVPSPVAGTVKEIHLEAGAKVEEGDLLATIEVDEEGEDGSEEDLKRPDHAAAPRGAPAPAEGADQDEGSEPEAPAEEEEGSEQDLKRPGSVPAEEQGGPSSPPRPAPMSETPIFDFEEGETESDVTEDEDFRLAHASPAVRKFARQLGVDLAHVEGSGRKGRITREDVQGFVKQAMEGDGTVGQTALPAVPEVDFARFGPVERVELSRIQKIAGPRLQASWINIPHVTQHDAADITDLEEFRQDYKDQAEERDVKLTLLPFILKACVNSLQRYPRVNASLEGDGEHLILKQYWHLGVAVDTEDGLIVPVLRDADRKGVLELAAELGELAAAARDGQLKPGQLQGATFTISSLGGIGGTAFTPVVNAPEAAILGVSRAAWKPVWDGERFQPRRMLPLSLSYDHRIVDGALAARFTRRIAEVLQDLRRLVL